MARKEKVAIIRGIHLCRSLKACRRSASASARSVLCVVSRPAHLFVVHCSATITTTQPQIMNIPRPKTSKGNREIKIENIIDDLDAILTEPSQPSKSPAQHNQPSKKQEISTEEQDELINEFLRNESQANISRSATNSIVPPLNLQVGQGQTTSREPVKTAPHDQVCRNCGAQTVSLRLTPVTSRICCLKCSHTYEKTQEKGELTDKAPVRSDSPVDPTSRTNYANTTRRSSDQSEREDGHVGTEDANQKARKHKHKKCRLCNQNRNSVRFMPCKHKACAECAADLAVCPVEKCQQTIQEKVAYHRSKSVSSKKNED